MATLVSSHGGFVVRDESRLDLKKYIGARHGRAYNLPFDDASDQHGQVLTGQMAMRPTWASNE